jgi:hypothetical protein
MILLCNVLLVQLLNFHFLMDHQNVKIVT